jgi:uncharacterized protein YggE
VQLIERAWGITAYGAASVRAKPDLVRVSFKVTRVQQQPSDAFAAANDAAVAVRQTLRAHQIEDAGVERSQLDLKSLWSYGTERKFLGYGCSASFVVESAALDDVQSLLVDVVAAGANEIDSVDFDVRAKQELRTKARREAVQAARRKAGLYAEAAGVRLGAVVHIDDVDPDNVGNELRGHAMAGDGSAQALAPGHVVVSAAVILGFSINYG